MKKHLYWIGGGVLGILLMHSPYSFFFWPIDFYLLNILDKFTYQQKGLLLWIISDTYIFIIGALIGFIIGKIVQRLLIK